MTTFLKNNEWALKKNYDYFIAFSVTTLAFASITDGWYFSYTDGAGTKYYVWFDKVGDESGDPAPSGYTKVTVDISGETTAADVAGALATALNALTNTSASNLSAVVQIVNASNEVNSSVVDVNTTFTFEVLGYAAEDQYPSANALTAFREDAHGLIITEADGVPELDEKYLRNLEYRMVELMMDEEQGRSTEEGRPIYIPRDYMYERDRTKVGNSGTDGFTRRLLIV